MSKSAFETPSHHRPQFRRQGDSVRAGNAGMACVAVAAFFAAAAASWSEEALDVKLHASGMVEIIRGKASLATMDLNAHGPGWEYASQKDTKAAASDLPNGAGKRFEGAFPIPKTEGGTVRYTESVRMLPQGFQLEYDLILTNAVKLNGLQLSLSLPVAGYAGKELAIAQLSDDPALVGLPKDYQEGQSYVWRGEGARIELAKGTSEAITVELRAVTDVFVQDLRQWKSPLFEVRFPAILEDTGAPLPAGTRFHLDVTVTFAAPVRLVGS